MEDFKSIVKESLTIKEVILKLGMNFSSSHYKTFHSRIEKEDIDISHFDPYINRDYSKNEIPLNEILVENSGYSRTSLKERLLKEGLLKNICEKCGISNCWNNKPLTLHIDHKNGVNNDNRIENLRILCPNCHSQTDTFGSKNSYNSYFKNPKDISCKSCGVKRKSGDNDGYCWDCYKKYLRADRPSREVLEALTKEKSFLEIGRIYGVSGNSIVKWCKAYGLPYRKKDIKN